MMKYLYLLIIVTLLGACSANESESESSTVNLDAREVSTIKIGNLEVMTEDLERTYTWDDAMKACSVLGDGWRLPTKDELNLLYENKEKIGGFTSNVYWSSSVFDFNFAVAQFFLNGGQNFNPKYSTYYVRAVRAF